ncbi:hypothetical protein [Metasolibacillus sp. FSL K6-0083]|uniref:hypothetical protein n=1 Tax=Metasolibacillus sp. FSL K6-0083 TaxID=2921416 RepID=UPI00315AE6EF
MERNQILVVGGYGQVGSSICRQLERIYPGKVWIASRDIQKAQHLIKESQGSIKAISLDINKPFDVSVLQHVKQVIVCEVKSFINGIKVYFGKKIGWHIAYDFNFANQHVLRLEFYYEKHTSIKKIKADSLHPCSIIKQPIFSVSHR